MIANLETKYVFSPSSFLVSSTPARIREEAVSFSRTQLTNSLMAEKDSSNVAANCLVAKTSTKPKNIERKLFLPTSKKNHSDVSDAEKKGTILEQKENSFKKAGAEKAALSRKEGVGIGIEGL